VAKGSFSFAAQVAERYREGRVSGGALLVRPDAQVVACWPAAPPDPRVALAAAVPWLAEPAGSRR
jgi:hypothetical protein